MNKLFIVFGIISIILLSLGIVFNSDYFRKYEHILIISGTIIGIFNIFIIANLPKTPKQ